MCCTGSESVVCAEVLVVSGEGVWLDNARYWRQQGRSMKPSPSHTPYTLGGDSYTHTYKQGKTQCIQYMHYYGTITGTTSLWACCLNVSLYGGSWQNGHTHSLPWPSWGDYMSCCVETTQWPTPPWCPVSLWLVGTFVWVMVVCQWSSPPLNYSANKSVRYITVWSLRASFESCTFWHFKNVP